jgi:hypothetical protein
MNEWNVQDDNRSLLSSIFLADGGVRRSTRPFSRITFNAACSAARTTSSLWSTNDIILTPSHWTPHELSNSWTLKQN